MSKRARTYRDGETITGPVTDVHGVVWTEQSFDRHVARAHAVPPAKRDRRGRFTKRGVLARLRGR